MHDTKFIPCLIDLRLNKKKADNHVGLFFIFDLDQKLSFFKSLFAFYPEITALSTKKKELRG